MKAAHPSQRCHLSSTSTHSSEVRAQVAEGGHIVQTAIAAGRCIAKRYRLIEPIGDGGMGTVWRARDQRLDIDVALKLQRGAAAGSERERLLARFADEAELSARMLSPNVVRVLDRGVDDDGAPYIAYELLTGDELGVRMGREGRLSLALCAELIVQTSRALARAHSVGVVHMDIKPENIFLCDEATERPLVKVLDFGIARLRGRESGASVRREVAGTLQYMSPEVLLHGRSPDARSDLYSLAVVAYECFTGRLPYQGTTLGEMLLEHTQTRPAPPSSLRSVKSELGVTLDAWFERALHPDPEQRFQSAKEMAEAFVMVHRPQRPSGRPGPVRSSILPSAPRSGGSDRPISSRPPRESRTVSEYHVIRDDGEGRNGPE